MRSISSDLVLEHLRGRVLRWPLLFATLILVRLYLTGDRDILALNAPYDEYWFVDAAARHIWGAGRYDQRSFAQLPIYPIWLCLVHLVGAPAHLAIDVAWIGACGYLARAVHRFTGRLAPAAVLFAFLLFHPLSIVIFDRALAETLLSVLTVFVLGAGIELWNRRDPWSLGEKWGLPVCYPTGYALAFHTRKEGVVLLAPIIILALLWLCQQCGWLRGSQANRRTYAVLVLYPLVATLALGLVLAGANYCRWGVFARYDLAAPGYLKAMASLAAIDNGRTPRDITITASTRALAYQESPTFRELQPYFEGEAGRSLATYTAQFTGVPGEIGNGWFYWAIREFAARAGWHSSAVQANTKYLAMSNELDMAFETGRLKKRSFVISGFIDPDYSKWIADFPRAVLREARLTGAPLYDYFRSPAEDATSKQFAKYVEVLGRRNLPQLTIVSGWVVASRSDLIGLERVGGSVDWVSLGTNPRPDVPGGLPFSVNASGYPPTDALLLRESDGRVGHIALNHLKRGAMATTDGDIHLTLGVDDIEMASEASRIERLFTYLRPDTPSIAWIDQLDTLYTWIGNMLWAATLGVIVVELRAARRSAALALVVLCLAGVLARCAILGLLDASSWSGLQARYVMPAIGMFGCMGVVSIDVILALANQAAVRHGLRR